MIMCRIRSRCLGLATLLGLLGFSLVLAGCDAGSTSAPPLSPTPVTRTVRIMPTFTPLPRFTATPVPSPTDTPAPSPTATLTPAATATSRPVATATPTRKPQPQPTRRPPTPTTSPFLYLPDGPVRYESNPSFTQIQGTVRAADGTPLDGVIVVLNTGSLEIQLPTGQRPGYYAWVWCDWSRDGTFELYVLGPDGQPASPRVVVQTFSEGHRSVAILDWRRTR